MESRIFCEPNEPAVLCEKIFEQRWGWGDLRKSIPRRSAKVSVGVAPNPKDFRQDPPKRLNNLIFTYFIYFSADLIKYV